MVPVAGTDSEGGVDRGATAKLVMSCTSARATTTVAHPAISLPLVVITGSSHRGRRTHASGTSCVPFLKVYDPAILQIIKTPSPGLAPQNEPLGRMSSLAR